MGTVHLLEAVRHTPSVRAVVNVTTDKCYENKEWHWGYREDEPMGGFDPYSNSKGCSELVTRAYRQSFFQTGTSKVALASARAGNVIGGGDWALDRLIPDTVTAFEQGKPVTIRNPHAIRPWQHVLEPLCGYLTLAEHLYTNGTSYAEAWNFGPSDLDAKPVGWIVEHLAALWGNDAKWQIDSGDHPHEAHYLKLDISKARSRLDWHPKLPLIASLKLIVQWQRHRQSGAPIRQFTLDQIHAYQAITKNS
jgi:CDP-glucose 4,6-dehydratase